MCLPWQVDFQYVKKNAKFSSFAVDQNYQYCLVQKTIKQRPEKTDLTLVVKNKDDTLTRCFHDFNTISHSKYTDNSFKE